MAFSQQTYQGQGIEQPRELNQTGQLLGQGILAAGKGLGDGLQKHNQNKAQRKMFYQILKSSIDAQKETGMISPDEAAQKIDEAEGLSLPGLQGKVYGLAEQMAIKSYSERMAERERQNKRQAQADGRAQEQHEAAMQSHNQALVADEQTQNVLRSTLEEPKPVTTINAPVPGMDKVSGRTSPEVPTVETRIPSRREMLVDAVKKNPKARIGDILKQISSGQPSVTEQIAIQKYNDDQKAKEVPGVGMARTTAAAKEVIEFKTTVEDTEKGIDGLTKILDTPGKAFSPKARAEAQTLTSMLKGSLRLAIVGPGAMTEKEMKLLDDIVANPTSLKKLDSTVRATFNKLRTHLNDQLETRYKNNIDGYKPKPEPDVHWSGYSMQ